MSFSSWLQGVFASRKTERDEELDARDRGQEALEHEGLPGQDTAGADVADGVLDEFKAPRDPNP